MNAASATVLSKDPALPVTSATEQIIPEIFQSQGKMIVERLFKMMPLDIPEYLTRSQFVKLAPNSKAKILRLWNGLTNDQQKEILESIETELAAKGNKSQKLTSQSNAYTTADDLSRLLHMFVDPAFAVQWQRSFQVMERHDLDAIDVIDSPFEMIAESFNDYEFVIYKNVCVLYDDSGKPCGAVDEFKAVYKQCSTFNPSNPARPFRDGDWVKKQLMKLKSDFIKIYANFTRSGNHEAVDIYREFAAFCGNNFIPLYAFAVFDGKNDFINLLGKLLPDGIGRDNSGLREDDYFTTDSTPRKRQKTEGTPPQKFIVEAKASDADEITALLKIINCDGIDEDNKRKAAEILSLVLKRIQDR